jgi:WD40 repeat protein
MAGYRFIAATLSLFLCPLAGCTAALQNSKLPEGFAIRSIARVDAGAPFAVNRTGAVAAMAGGALQVIDLSGGTGRRIAPAPATDLCFSPKGERLAAAFATNDKSLLRLFDLQGKVLAEAIITGRVTSIGWRSEKELLATVLVMRRYSFGSELTGLLYRWNGEAPPAATPLSSVTARPQIAQLPEATLFGSLSMALSPYGDEIAYSTLKDPPLFTPYLRIAVRHIDTGAEREVAQSPIGSGGLLYAPDGESLLVGETRGLSRRLSLPDGREIYAWPASGDQTALSPSGSYAFMDGRLYQGGREITWLPEARGAFLPDGSGLVISQDRTLSLITGLNDRQPPGLQGNLERILELRRLRMLGLITDKEFKARKKSISAR